MQDKLAQRSFGRLENLYSQIAALTEDVPVKYPFLPCRIDCQPDSCCTHSAFPVSTTEAAYLIAGLPDERYYRVRRRARKELEKFHRSCGYGRWTDLFETVAKHRLVCPLYEDGACSLYERRPVICRCYGSCAIVEKGKKKPYGCARVRDAIVEHVKGGGEILLPDFKQVERLMEGVLYGSLRPLVAWLAE